MIFRAPGIKKSWFHLCLAAVGCLVALVLNFQAFLQRVAQLNTLYATMLVIKSNKLVDNPAHWHIYGLLHDYICTLSQFTQDMESISDLFSMEMLPVAMVTTVDFLCTAMQLFIHELEVALAHFSMIQQALMSSGYLICIMSSMLWLSLDFSRGLPPDCIMLGTLPPKIVHNHDWVSDAFSQLSRATDDLQTTCLALTVVCSTWLVASCQWTPMVSHPMLLFSV